MDNEAYANCFVKNCWLWLIDTIFMVLKRAMGRASFEYDEVGNTFYYVLVSFYAIILLPATYFFFPTGKFTFNM
ncbi:hypothetical protein COOONC_21932 [Cooperia oncophora]